MPLDHFSVLVPTSKIDAMVTFLTSSLDHLGFKVYMRPAPHVVGMGDGTPYLWLAGLGPEDGDEKMQEGLVKRQHVAFTAEDTDQVRKFHAAALKAGGTCNGKPGLRPESHPGYYAAFVHDPVCGVNFEVVCHSAGGEGEGKTG